MLDIFSRIDSINQKYGINTNRYMKELLERMIEEIVEKAADKYGRQVVVRGVKAMDSDNYTFPFLTSMLAPEEVVPEYLAVVMPMTSPLALNIGPPELPELMAASVWIILITVPSVVMSRSMPLM